jgi:methyl-accepting chemotaxis protein
MKILERVDAKIMLWISVMLILCVVAISIASNLFIQRVSMDLVLKLYPVTAENIETKAQLYVEKGTLDPFTLFSRKVVDEKLDVTYIHYIDKEKKYAASTDPAKVGTPYKGAASADALEQGQRSLTWLSGETFEVVSPLFVQISEYLPDERNGTILIGFTLHTVKGSMDIIKNVILVAIVLFSILIEIVVLIQVRRIVGKPIGSLILSLESLSKNEGDLTKTLPVNSEDEIGTLSKSFNAFLLSLNGIIKKIQASIENTTNLGQTLSSSSTEAAAAIEEIRANMVSIMSHSVDLDAEITDSDGLISDAKDSVDTISQLIAAQAADVNESSASVQQMIASIRSVAQTSESKLKVVDTLQSQATTGAQAIEETVAVIRKVTDSANVIMDIVRVINGISSKTNILAMNAAIEAAHAGDYGKGFSVVADEIRLLAEDTSVHSQEISASMEEILEYIRTSEESSARTGEFFNSIFQSIKEVAGGMAEICNAMAELSTGGNQINQSLTSLIQISTNVEDSSSGIKRGMEGIGAAVKKVSGISSETKNGMSEMTGALDEISAAVQAVSAACSQTAENAEACERLVGKFKVD